MKDLHLKILDDEYTRRGLEIQRLKKIEIEHLNLKKKLVRKYDSFKKDIEYHRRMLEGE